MEIRPAKKTDMKKVIKMRSEIFNFPINAISEGILMDPYFKPENTRLLLNNKKLILSNLTIHPRNILYGNDKLFCGMIDGVCTPEKLRNRKYADYVIDDAINYMGLKGFDFSLLDGRADFYLKFDWEPLIITEMQFSNFKKGKQKKGKYSIKFCENPDKKVIQEIYAKNIYSNTGNMVRPREYWQFLFDRRDMMFKDEFFIVAKKLGKIVAYIRGKKIGSNFYVQEFCSLQKSEDLVEEIIKFILTAKMPNVKYDNNTSAFLRLEYDIKDILKEIIKPQHVKNIFLCFENSKIAGHFRKFSNIQIPKKRNLLLRLINISSFIEKIKPALEQRIRNSKKEIKEFNIFFITPAGKVLIKIKNNELSIEKKADENSKELLFNHENLARLIFGKYGTIKSLSINGAKKLSKEEEKIIGILFPRQEFTFWKRDME